MLTENQVNEIFRELTKTASRLHPTELRIALLALLTARSATISPLAAQWLANLILDLLWIEDENELVELLKVLRTVVCKTDATEH